MMHTNHGTMTTPEETLAALCAWCLQKHGNQAKLVRHLGCSKQAVSDWIRGISSPDLETAERISDFLSKEVHATFIREIQSTMGLLQLNSEQGSDHPLTMPRDAQRITPGEKGVLNLIGRNLRKEFKLVGLDQTPGFDAMDFIKGAWQACADIGLIEEPHGEEDEISQKNRDFIEKWWPGLKIRLVEKASMPQNGQKPDHTYAKRAVYEIYETHLRPEADNQMSQLAADIIQSKEEIKRNVQKQIEQKEQELRDLKAILRSVKEQIRSLKGEGFLDQIGLSRSKPRSHALRPRSDEQ
jgi:transcriptional regulator with XRE-family HTH domain